eukprot:Ihof_evm7s216 gene=Ihof_evmTU7s216
MRLQQVIMGAANNRPYAVAVGRIGGTTCVVYAKASHLVILHGEDFGLIQNIASPDDCTEEISCVQWSNMGGRIAAANGEQVLIYEPTHDSSNGSFPYRWILTAKLKHHSIVNVLSWSHTGTKLLTGGEVVRLYENKVSFYQDDSTEDEDTSITTTSTTKAGDKNEGKDPSRNILSNDKDTWSLEWET